ncbi:MAG: FHA domain-containing protein [Clostridia bacterium]|nr:FHA domain-containing protein [Clostridia bacterium]
METLAYITRYILPIICVTVAVVCLSSLLKTKSPKVTPAVFVDNLNGEQYPITHWETSIGRSNSCDIVLNFETVSRFHAVLTKQKKGWVLTDTFSRTGTYINGEKISEPTVIQSGDKVIFGGTSLTFRER